MPRFNVLFLLKATTATALCSVPMAFAKESGFVWTAFLLPIAIGWLVSREVPEGEPFKVELSRRSDSEIEIVTSGGRYAWWFWRFRILAAGFCLSPVIGAPTLHTIDPEPLANWVPWIAFFVAVALLLVGVVIRQRYLIVAQQFVTEYRLFGRLVCWRSCWRVRLRQSEGDTLEVLVTPQTGKEISADFRYRHQLRVYRPSSDRSHSLAESFFPTPRPIQSIEAAAESLSKQTNLPYVGYRIEEATEPLNSDPPPRLRSSDTPNA